MLKFNIIPNRKWFEFSISNHSGPGGSQKGHIALIVVKEVADAKIVAAAAINAPGALGVVQGVHREAILNC